MLLRILAYMKREGINFVPTIAAWTGSFKSMKAWLPKKKLITRYLDIY
ncbi:hypothetical protein HanPI659440_Chr16g0633051 [Helianthus annuus]|nr:hypothetical protein HanPI659440_Chr16g0633051 [Helianthus annuus]